MSLGSPSTDGQSVLVQRLKDSGLAALLTLVLCIPIILLPTEKQPNSGELALILRPMAVLVLMALAFVGRFAALSLGVRPKREKAAPKVSASAKPGVAAGVVTFVGLLFLFL